jgi:hypothetical protein
MQHFDWILGSLVVGQIIGWWGRYLYEHGIRHKWVEVSRTYVPPQSWSDVHSLVQYNDRAKHMTGFTTVLFQCSVCSQTRSVDMQGEVHHPKVVPLRGVTGGRK